MQGNLYWFRATTTDDVSARIVIGNARCAVDIKAGLENAGVDCGQVQLLQGNLERSIEEEERAKRILALILG